MKGVERIAIIVVDTDSGSLKADLTDAGKLQERILTKHAQGASEKLADKTAIQLGKGAVRVFQLTKQNGQRFQKPGDLAGEIGKFLKDAKSYGIYIIMHGTSDGLPAPPDRVLFPAGIAAFLENVTKKHGDSSAFKKLNLVACNLGKALESGHKHLRKGASFAQALCEQLKNKDTMVAAYTVPVYVYWPENPEIKPGFGVPGLKVPSGVAIGQRLVQPDANKPDLVTATAMADGNKATPKVVWRWNGKEAERVPLEDYKK